MFHDIAFLDGDSLKVRGVSADYLNFVIEDQLLDTTMWGKMVEPFLTKEDSDGFWRGEFFGKEMRGASLAYRLTKNERLYEVLTEAVRSLLKAQEEDGRISSYSRETEFNGWDMWCRKYVLTGLLHYYDICKDESFKREILAALKKHLDYVIGHIGPKEEGKKSITETSSWWGCVNSCTILEPTLALYTITKEERYLSFAKYIIGTGGSSDCSFIDLALENELLPYQYPVTKAYETMSFFEGLLAYYEITKEEKYLRAVTNFLEAVSKSDLTLIGCSGCTHELFDHSSIRQSEPSKEIMQETCVAVTWMRISARMYLLTGEKKYLDRIEESALNDLYGSLNTKHETQHNLLSKIEVPAMTFDSYSPLFDKERGQGTGGYLEFHSGGHCGCCVAIGACGVALYPLTFAFQAKEGLILSSFFTGEIKGKDENGNPYTLSLRSDFPRGSSMLLQLEASKGAKISIFLKTMQNSSGFLLDNKEIPAKDGYIHFEMEGEEKKEISFEPLLSYHRLNGKIAFTHGPLTLAVDEAKSCRPILEKVTPIFPLSYRVLKPVGDEFVRLEIALKDGSYLLLSDYQSAGKHWNQEKNKISVWLPEEE